MRSPPAAAIISVAQQARSHEEASRWRRHPSSPPRLCAASKPAYDRTAVVRSLGVPVSGRLDEPAARKIAVTQGVGVVMSGSLDRQGNGFVLSVKATEAVTGRVIQIAEETVSKKDQVLYATTKVVTAVRKALGDDTSDSALRFAMETITATSLEAIHEYAMGMEALSNGKHEAAVQSFSKAVDIDPNFAMAYSAMSMAARNLGLQEDALKYIKEALGRLDRVTERERYRLRATYYTVTGDQQKCVDEMATVDCEFGIIDRLLRDLQPGRS